MNSQQVNKEMVLKVKAATGCTLLCAKKALHKASNLEEAIKIAQADKNTQYQFII